MSTCASNHIDAYFYREHGEKWRENVAGHGEKWQENDAGRFEKWQQKMASNGFA
jgi:hypothetical protein